MKPATEQSHRVRRLLSALWIALLLGGNTFGVRPQPLLASDATSALRQTGIRVLESGAGSMLIEFTAGAYTVARGQRDGVATDGVTIPGTTLTAEPGKPRLPTLGALLALPTNNGAMIEVAMEIVETEIELLQNVVIANAPQIDVAQGLGDLSYGDVLIDSYTTSEPEYVQDAFYPSTAASLGASGRMRDLPVT